MGSLPGAGALTEIHVLHIHTGMMNLQGPFGSNVKAHNQLYAGTSCKICNNQFGKIVALESRHFVEVAGQSAGKSFHHMVRWTPQRLHAEIPFL